MTDWASVRYAVVDVEGNGQQPPDLVEAAVVPIVNGVISEPDAWLVKPPRPITPMATRIHGLANQDIASAPAFPDIASQLRRALDADVLVAHNAHIDVAVLQRHLGDWRCPEVLDTLKLARRVLPGQASYKLGALVSAFSLADGLPAGLSPHRATYDALVTARLFIRLTTHHTSPLSLEELRGQNREGAPMLHPFSSHERGLFVSVDGPSGAGKSTIVAHLTQTLVAAGERVHVTAEPSDGPIGVLCRELTESVTGHALACLYAADRYHHVETEIRPHLAKHSHVISDRYLPSGLVMQRFDGIDPTFLWQLNSEADHPDLAVILEADPEIIAERLAQRGPHNRFQLSPASSHAEAHFYRQATDRLIQAGFDVLRVECSQRPAEQSAAFIRDRLIAFFGSSRTAGVTA